MVKNCNLDNRTNKTILVQKIPNYYYELRKTSIPLFTFISNLVKK